MGAARDAVRYSTLLPRMITGLPLVRADTRVAAIRSLGGHVSRSNRSLDPEPDHATLPTNHHGHRPGLKLLDDTTNEGRGLLPGHHRGPLPGHQWGLFHGHGHPEQTYEQYQDADEQALKNCGPTLGMMERGMVCPLRRGCFD